MSKERGTSAHLSPTESFFPRRIRAHSGSKSIFFPSEDAVATCRDVLGSFVALPEPCESHVTANAFNDAKEYGPHAELFFSTTIHEAPETPIEPGHVSIESLFFFSSLGWQTCVSPLAMTLCARRHSKGFLYEWPEWPRGNPCVFCARRACTHWRIAVTTCELALTFFLKVSQHRHTFVDGPPLEGAFGCCPQPVELQPWETPKQLANSARRSLLRRRVWAGRVPVSANGESRGGD